jgi:hypothetical protein
MTEDVPQTANITVSNVEVCISYHAACRVHLAPIRKLEHVDDEIDEKWLDLAFTWSGKAYTLRIAESDR